MTGTPSGIRIRAGDDWIVWSPAGKVKSMEYYKTLLHLRFAAEVMGWTQIEPSRETGALKFYGVIHTNKGPQRREVPNYSHDLAAMWSAEQYLNRLGLTPAYIRALIELTGAADLSHEDDLFKLVSASPADRCAAGLKAFEVGTAGTANHELNPVEEDGR